MISPEIYHEKYHYLAIHFNRGNKRRKQKKN